MSSSAFRPHSSIWYRLHSHAFPGLCLDVVNDGAKPSNLELAPIGNFSGQYWQLVGTLNERLLGYDFRCLFTGSSGYLYTDGDCVRIAYTDDHDFTKPSVWSFESIHIAGKPSLFAIRSIYCENFYLVPRRDQSWFKGYRLDATLVEDSPGADMGWEFTEIRPFDQYDTLFRSQWSQYPSTAVENFYMSTLDIWVHSVHTEDSILFKPVSQISSHMDASLLLSYVQSFNKTKVSLVNVSDGFLRPKFLDMDANHDLNAVPGTGGRRYSEMPTTYTTRSLLYAEIKVGIGSDRRTGYILVISTGTVLTQLSEVVTPDTKEEYGIIGTAAFQLLGDEIPFKVNLENLHRVGLEDEIPETFEWTDRVFQRREIVPIQHISHLGQGGQALVDKVSCFGRVMARKVIRTSTNSSMGSRVPLETALEELKAIKKVHSHHHVIKIVGSYTQGNVLGILLHPAAECDLQTALERFSDDDKELFTGRMPYCDVGPRLSTYFGCLAHGLAFIHSQGIRHRDIKPSNILVTFDGPLYADFGIAHDFSDNTSSVTTGATLKSIIYCAPEVAAGTERGRSSDIFSLGCIFLELYTVLGKDGTYQDCRRKRQGETSASYNGNPVLVDKWLDQLEESLGNRDAFISRLLWMIRAMLNPDRAKRPIAHDIWKMMTIGHVTNIISRPFSVTQTTLCGSCCLGPPG